VQALDIAMEPSRTVRPPRVAASPVSIECRLHSTNELGDSTVVLGDVTTITVLDEVLDGKHPDFTKLDPLARLGKDEWALHAEVIAVPRPVRPEDIQQPPA
jgi:flavin reductase (DIM6/NTAB) family NADH-FMN oxidoreductase RutF